MQLLNENRTNAVNDLYNLINKVMGQILESLENGYKLKKDGSLYEKNRKAISNIIDKHKTSNSQQCWLESSHYSTYLRFRTNFQLNEGNFSSYEYLEECVYIISNDFDLMSDSIKSTEIDKGLVEWGGFQRFEPLTHKQVEKKYNSIRQLETKIADIEKQISNHKKNARLHLGS